MWFNIVLSNHGSPEQSPTIEQQSVYLRSALISCGYQAIITHNALFHDAMNLMFEYFPGSGAGEAHATLRRQGIRFGIIATELMTPSGIPYGRDGIFYFENGQRMSESETDRMNAIRLAGFYSVIPHASFVWSFLERTAAHVANLHPESYFFPIVHVPPGTTFSDGPKDIDIFHYGSITPHRRRVLQAMMDAGLKVVVAGRGTDVGYLPGYLLDSYVDRSKIVLNLTLTDTNPLDPDEDPRFASGSRLRHLLDRHACVVSESIPLDNPYRPFLVEGEAARLSGLCADLIVSNTYREQGKRNGLAFAASMNPETMLKPVVARTLAAIGAN